MERLATDSEEPGEGFAGEKYDALPRAELKRRASAGVFIVGTRGVAILLVGFCGNVVVARLLTPHAFGLVAIGLSFVLFTNLLSDGGLGGGLIRRPEPPDADELRALTALQLTVTVVLALAVAAAAAPFGEVGWVTAVMVSSTPLVALQFPGRILLERSLRYRPLAALEVAQVLTFYVWAIVFVAIGFGVWGLASATVARGAAGLLIMARVSPVGLVRPRFAWRLIRPLIGFGVRFQAATATWLVRDQGLNMSIAAIASVATLGLWSLARRLMEVPFLLFETLWRVSFPTMSQLLTAKEDAAPLVERALGMAAVGAGVILTALAGSAPGLIPGVFGAHWEGAVDVIPPACLGLAISGSMNVACVGYLYAVGDATAVLQATICDAIVWFAVSLPLLTVVGVTAVGLGWLASSVVAAVMIGRATLKWTRVRLVRPLFAPVVSGVVSGAGGWFVADAVGRDLLSGLAGGACSVLGFVACLAVLRRDLLYETIRFAVGALRAAGSGSTAAGAAQPSS